MKKVWILYDERARTEGTDNAAVLVVAALSRRELRADSEAFANQNAIWAEYTVGADGFGLENEKLRPELYSDILRAERQVNSGSGT